MSKVCTTCKQDKDYYEYSYNSRTRDKMSTQCKKCLKDRRKKTDLEIIQRKTKDTDLKW